MDIDIMTTVSQVLMSATIEGSLFSHYFNCPVLTVAGRMHPVTVHYIEEVT